jgi:hypothetical protein
MQSYAGYRLSYAGCRASAGRIYQQNQVLELRRWQSTRHILIMTTTR